MSARNKILIVDDEVKACNILKDYLEKLFEVDVAHDGQQALKIIEEFQPNCVLLDYKMPDMDGLEVLDLIVPKHPDLKIIMVTAIGEVSLGAKCIVQGAHDFIVKPVNLDELKGKILSALEYQ